MSQTELYFPSIYNPANQSDIEVISNFIVRLPEFEGLFASIKNDKMKKPPQHFMIQGQRGYGKTTLLLRLKIEIKNDQELNTWLIPVMFDEESYSVRTLAKLWEEVIDILEVEDTAFEGLGDKIDEFYNGDSPEEEIYNLLIKKLKEQKKKIVLLLDNFGEMIQKFSKKENQRLREVLITSNDIRFIGASSEILEFYYDYKQPFFDFFKVITLDELNRDEVILLLKKLGESYKSEEINKVLENQPERIEALRRLTGGVPRTIVLLFQIFADDVNGNSFKDLEVTLDKVTPLYKHRLDSLKSSVQQAIFDVIAQNWDALSTGEIAKKVRMPSKDVSSQLNQLEKNQLIDKISTSTKNQLYQIKERFFNIYYLMRLGRRKNRNKVLWLIKFFEIMCGEKELIARVQNHIKGMHEKATYEKHAFYVTQALARTLIPQDLQHELINETKKFLSEAKSEFSKDIYKSHFEILDEVKEDVINGKYDYARKKLKEDGMNSAEISFTVAELIRIEKQDFNLAIKFYEKAISETHLGAMFNLAMMYQIELKDFKQAERYFLMAVEKGDSSAMNNLARLYYYELKDNKRALKHALQAIEKGNAKAMKGLAIMYETEFKDFENAKKYYLMAIEKENSGAMFNLALLYQTEFKDFENAKKYYLMAIEKENSGAMINLALLYQTEFKDFENAKKYYLMAIEKEDSGAMFNLASLYQTEFNDFKNAKKYYLMAIEKENSGAMFNLASLYQTEFKDFENAKKYYLMAIEKEDSGAMFNLASLYQTELKDFENAKKYYLMAIEKEDSEAMNNLASLYQREFKDFENAKKYYLMAIENDNSRAMNNLASLYQTEFKDFENAKKYYLMAIEKEDSGAMNNLAWLYYELKKNKNASLEIQRKAFEIIKQDYAAHTLLMILLWNDEIAEATKVFKDYFDNENAQKDVNEMVYSALKMFLAKKQYHFVYNLFAENKFDIRDKYKPISYTTLKLMGEEYSDEFKRMPPELKETVEELLKDIEQMSIDYK